MNKLYSLLGVLGLVLLTRVPVGAVIEGGKDSTTGVIDSSVKGVATVSTAVLEDVSDITATAAKVPSGVIETVVKNDNQTDELQDKDTSEKRIKGFPSTPKRKNILRVI